TGEAGRGRASVEAPVHLLSMEGLADGLDDGLAFRKDQSIPESQHAIAVRTEILVAIGVVASISQMLTAIELYDYARLEADEIADVLSHRSLAAELEAIQLAAPKMSP